MGANFYENHESFHFKEANRKEGSVMETVLGTWRKLVLFGFIVACFFISTTVAISEEPKIKSVEEEKVDPFAPIELKKEPVPSSELEKYDLSQFELQGIVIMEKERRAMVKAPNGESYIVRKGTKIGKNQGEIILISTCEIVVLENFKVGDKVQPKRTSLKIAES